MEEIYKIIDAGWQLYIEKIDSLYLFTFLLLCYVVTFFFKTDKIAPKVQLNWKAKYFNLIVMVLYAPLYAWLELIGKPIKEIVSIMFFTNMLAIFIEYVFDINKIVDKWTKKKFPVDNQPVNVN